MNLKYRSDQKEFLDGEDIKPIDLYTNLRELHVINALLGGYKASRKGLSEILRLDKVKNLIDVGFGGGDFIRQLSVHAGRFGASPFFYGVDLKKDCVAYAQNNLLMMPGKELICDDYRNLPAALLEKTDVIHFSLFLHHLSDQEIIELFRFARENNCIVLANDLHRHFLAYYSIKLLTFLFSRSYLVKNDAPLSVARGFKKKELIGLLQQSGFSNFSVTWSWAFRFIIIARP